MYTRQGHIKNEDKYSFHVPDVLRRKGTSCCQQFVAHARMLAGPIRFKLWLVSIKSMETITRSVISKVSLIILANKR